MPELPEVETVRRGLAGLLTGRWIRAVAVLEPRLRWPVDPALSGHLTGRRVLALERRSKFLLVRLDRGGLILHLGMSGTLRVVSPGAPLLPHDHVRLGLGEAASGPVTRELRYNDPRRFGSVHWTDGPFEAHRLLEGIGPEPFDAVFDGAYLHRRARGSRRPVKNFLMDTDVVAGVGNIYATEALFAAGIRPDRKAGRISRARYARLAAAVREVLAAAIAQGGTTLRDFTDSSGRPGYFRVSLRAYGRHGSPCDRCGRPLVLTRIANRATVFCRNCQR